MTYERWQDITSKVKSQFTVQAEGKEPLAEGPGEREFIEFTGPTGRVRLELVKRPVVLDKKTFYSKRIGSSTAVEYVYDESRETLTLHAYTWDSGEHVWREAQASAFGG